MTTQGEETRRKIIDAVIELLKVKGYNGVGLQEIINESGTPKGSLYFHFPGGKQEIVEVAVKQYGENIQKYFRSAILNAADIASGVKKVINYMIRELESSAYTKGCLVANTAIDLPGTSNTTIGICAQCFSLMRDVIAERLKKDRVKAIEADELATLILSSFEGAIILSKAYRNPEPLNILAERLPRLLAKN